MQLKPLENVKLFSSENKIIYDSLLKELKNDQNLSKNDLSLDPQILDKITQFASIKHILNKIENHFRFGAIVVVKLVDEILQTIDRSLTSTYLEVVSVCR